MASLSPNLRTIVQHVRHQLSHNPSGEDAESLEDARAKLTECRQLVLRICLAYESKAGTEKFVHSTMAMDNHPPHKKLKMSVLGPHIVMADLMVFREIVQYLTPQQMAKWTSTCTTLYKTRSERLRVFAVTGVTERYSANLVAFVNGLKGAYTIDLAGRCTMVVVISM